MSLPVKSPHRGSLVAALAPRSAVLVRPSFGIAPIFMALGKGLVTGAQFVNSSQGQDYMAKAKKLAESNKVQYNMAKQRYRLASSKESKRRWKKRMLRYKEKVDQADWTAKLAEKGLVGEGPVLEYRRNLAAMEWDSATPKRQAAIERQVKRFDGRLKKLYQEYVLLQKMQGSDGTPTFGAAELLIPPDALATSQLKKRIACLRSVRAEVDQRIQRRKGRGQDVTQQTQRLDAVRWRLYKAKKEWRRRHPAPPPRPRIAGSAALTHSKTLSKLQRTVDRAMVTGVGGIRFSTIAPPGPGRLVRIPLFPKTDSESWSGVNGIDQAGDDSILRIQITTGTRVSSDYVMETRSMDYGTYRLVGFQTVDQSNYELAENGTLTDVAITLKGLSLYNGMTLFLQDDDVWSETFSIIPGDRLMRAMGGNTDFVEHPADYQRRRSRFFAGLRDYPVVSGKATVSVTVRAFTGFNVPNNSTLNAPFACFLVAQMVEDKVFGDPVSPGPYARAGALTKMGAKELGLSMEGQDQIEVVSAGWLPE